MNYPKRKFSFRFPAYTKLFMYMALISPIILGANMILSKNLGVLETLYSKECFYSILAIPSLVIISTIFLILLRSIYRLKDIYYGIICGIHELGNPNTKNKKAFYFIFALFSGLILLILGLMPHSLLNNGIYITHFIIVIVLILTLCILHYTSISASEKSYTAYDLVYLLLLAVLIIIFIMTVNLTWMLFFSTEIYTMGPTGYNESIAETLGSTPYQPPQMYMSSGQNGSTPVSLGNQSNVPNISISGTSQGNVPHTSVGGRGQGNIPHTSMGETSQGNVPHNSMGGTSQDNVRHYMVRRRVPHSPLIGDYPARPYPPVRPMPSLLELSNSFERDVWGITGREINPGGYPPPVHYPPNPYLPLLQHYMTDPNFDPRAPLDPNFEFTTFHSRDLHNLAGGSGQTERLQDHPIRDTNSTGGSGQSYDPIRNIHNPTGNLGQSYDPIRDTHNPTGGSGQLTGYSSGNTDSNTNNTSASNTHITSIGNTNVTDTNNTNVENTSN